MKFINKKEKKIIDCIKLGYRQSENFQEGYSRIIKNGEGSYNHFINELGEIVLSIDKTKSPFLNGLALGQEGYFDYNGKIIVPIKWRNNQTKMNINGNVFLSPSYFQNELLLVRKLIKGNIQNGFLNKLGEIEIDLKYGIARPFNNGFSVVGNYVKKKGSKKTSKEYYIINTKNQKILDLPDGIETIGYNRDNYVVFENKKDKLLSIIDIKNTIINLTPIKSWSNWSQDTIFSEGLAKVKINKKFGMINSLGEIIIKPIFKDLGLCKEGLIPATLNGKKWGYINIKSEWIIEEKYKQANSFSNALAYVIE